MKYFHFYNDDLETLREMTPEARGRLLLRLCEHSCGAEYTEETGSEERLLSGMLCRRIDRDKERYEETCERNRTNGMKGGRPPKNRAVSEKPTITQEEENKNKKEEKNKDKNEKEKKSKKRRLSASEKALEQERTKNRLLAGLRNLPPEPPVCTPSPGGPMPPEDFL